MHALFDGQQEDERILFKVHGHSLVHLIQTIKIVLIGLLLAILFWIIGGGVAFGVWLRFGGLVLGLLVGAIGWWSLTISERKTVAYITDRRVVRFSATTPWTINRRSISWDEVVKIKTKTSNFVWRALNIGSVVIHARSTVVPLEEVNEQVVTNDDIQLDGIEYYQDLGNYLDKVLYLYKKEPEKMSDLRAFIPKPKGQRY
jgi:hypothetical protein